MANLNYHTANSMKNKRMSDIKTNSSFLDDAITFLKSDRLNYKDEDLMEMSASDISDKVLEHMRYQTVNERTMYKDYSFIADDTTPQKDKEAFTRLMFAFDNAKGEGLVSAMRSGDYIGGTLSSPTTMASAAVGLFTGGVGGVAVKTGIEAFKAGAKTVSATALRKMGKGILKRSLLTGAVDGSIGAGADLANQRIRQIGGKEIGEERDISLTQAATSGLIEGTVGTIASAIPAVAKTRASRKVAEATFEGEAAIQAKRIAAVELAKKLDAQAKKTPEGKALRKYVANSILQAIDPKMVEEGNIVRTDLFSEDLPDGLIGGFDLGTLQRISSAGVEIAREMGVTITSEGTPRKRITEVIADSIRDGDGKAMAIVDDIRKKYSLSREQLSTAYAAEVSDAARILRTARTARDAFGRDIGSARAANYADMVERLYEQGMSPIDAADAKAIDLAEKGGIGTYVVKKAKEAENMRRMFMTSQPATTMRNNIFSAAMTGIDFVDQLNTSIVRVIRNDPEATAGSTFKGSADNLAMLTKNAYVAEALVEMLNETAPKRMSKVFFDAAIAESVTLQEKTLMTQAGAAANVLNTMSDRVVKRGIIAGSINRQLRELGNEDLGTDVIDMMRKGMTNELPDNILQEAIDESLAFTFQRRFGGKDASQANKAAGALIRTIHNYGITLAIPFPRYLASQAKFVSDYTGLTLARRVAASKRIDDKEWAKSMTGAMGMTALLAMNMQKVHDGTEWNEVIDPTNDLVYDGQSAMGPLTAQQYMMDHFARRMEGMETKDTATVLKDLSKILGASEFRPDTGIVNDFVRFAEGTDTKGFTRSLADILAPMTYPAAVLKDFYGQFDPRSAYLANAEDATISMVDLYGKNISMAFLQRATKQLPDFNTQVMANTFNEMFGTDINPNGIISYLEFASTSTRTAYQSDYSKDAFGNDLGYDAISMDITADGPRRILNPLDKQLTGLIGRPPKNKLQREITRLQIDAFKDIYNPYQQKNRTLEIFFQQFSQGRFADTMANYIDSPEYQGYDASRQKLALIEMSSSVKTIYREAVKDHLERFVTAKPEIRADYESFIRSEYQAMSKRERDYANVNWENSRELYSPIFEEKNMGIDDAMKWINSTTNLTEEERRIFGTNVLRKYTEHGSILRKRAKSSANDKAYQYME